MKKILISILSVLYIAPAIAAKSDGNKWASAWGVNGVSVCGGATGLKDKDEATAVDVARYMVAYNIVEHGGYFCTVYIGAKSDCVGCDSYTVYYADPNEDCFWLCESGYFGEGCASNTPTMCNATFSKSLGDNYGELISNPGSWNNVENEISMLVNDNYHDCSSLGDTCCRDFNKMASWPDQEHDVVLAVKSIEDTTFTVMPLNVRAGKVKNLASMLRLAWPVTGFVGNSKILCPDGWRLNSAKTKCEKVSEQISDICSMENLCATTPRESYVEGMHTIVTGTNGESSDCKNFRCASSGQGFKAKNDFECIDCPNPRQGVDNDGVCITCETGYIFNTTSKKCDEAVALSQTAMRVGPNTTSDKLEDQCWIKDSPTEYRDCILKDNTDAKSE